LLEQGLERRRGWLDQQRPQSFRAFHGWSEGCPGVSLDRYGEMALLQLFRPTPDLPPWEELEGWCRQQLGCQLLVVWQREQRRAHRVYPQGPLPASIWAPEGDLQFAVHTDPRGQDPDLFLDTRSVRRWLRGLPRSGWQILNLFSYTCSLGIAADAAEVARVINVDFSASALEVGVRNAERNGCRHQEFVCEEAYPVLWQLAGRSLPARARKRGKPTLRLPATRFDCVLIDPPALSKGFFGSVDVVHDYQSLLRPCLELLAPGGRILACNNSPRVPLEAFLDVLTRCARKAGRPIASATPLPSDPDFPALGEAALKAIWLEFND
jgi:23S rRNA (cytosine1962-C5)-methyltransferase